MSATGYVFNHLIFPELI